MNEKSRVKALALPSSRSLPGSIGQHDDQDAVVKDDQHIRFDQKPAIAIDTSLLQLHAGLSDFRDECSLSLEKKQATNAQPSSEFLSLRGLDCDLQIKTSASIHLPACASLWSLHGPTGTALLVSSTSLPFKRFFLIVMVVVRMHPKLDPLDLQEVSG
jgi:hypothetical protein